MILRRYFRTSSEKPLHPSLSLGYSGESLQEKFNLDFSENNSF